MALIYNILNLQEGLLTLLDIDYNLFEVRFSDILGDPINQAN